jgi:TetR/AcrR family transcriptional regulator, transcriptional repressor for nem operon
MTISSASDHDQPAGTKRTQARGMERRDEILSVAIRHIARLGFEGLRVRDVAKEVGIHNASLHHHFPTKEDLIAAVVERFLRDFGSAQAEPLAGNADERLTQYVENVRKLMKARPDMFVVLNELLVRSARDADVARLMAHSQERWVAYIISLLDESAATEADKLEIAERYRYQLIGESLALGAEGALRLSAKPV